MINLTLKAYIDYSVPFYEYKLACFDEFHHCQPFCDNNCINSACFKFSKIEKYSNRQGPKNRLYSIGISPVRYSRLDTR